MKLLNKTLLYFDVPTKKGTIFSQTEFTRIRDWSKSIYGIYRSGTLLERLNGIMWLHEKYWKKDEYKEPYVINISKPYGQLGRPDQGLDTHIHSVSHTVSNIRIEDNKLIGDIKVLASHHGKTIIGIINELGENSIVFRPRYCFDSNGLMVFSFDALSEDIFDIKDKQVLV